MGGLINYEELFNIGEEFNMQQKKQEIIPLLQKIMRLPKRKWCLEIGSYEGGTARVLAKLFDNVISIDIEPQQDAWQKLRHDASNWLGIIGDSKADNVLALFDELKIKFDFIFIDGDHTAQGVGDDFVLYRKYLSKYGMIAFHDILDTEYHQENNCYVSDIWKELKPIFYHNEICYTGKENTGKFSSHLAASDWGGIGVIYNASPLCDTVSDRKIMGMMRD